MKEVESVTDLPFVEIDGERMDLWAAEESGVWALDNKIGRTHADECVRYMRHRQAPNLLSGIVKDMMAHGRYGGVEVGFLHRIGVHATRPDL